jgi:hypothetical protein
MLGLSGSISISNGGHVPLEDFLAVVRMELFHQGRAVLYVGIVRSGEAEATKDDGMRPAAVLHDRPARQVLHCTAWSRL